MFFVRKWGVSGEEVSSWWWWWWWWWGSVLIFIDRGIPSTGKALKETVNCL